MAGEPQGLVFPVVGGKANDPNSSGSTIIPPTTSFPIPEPARLNLTATVKPLPMPVTTPAQKSALVGKFWNVLNKAKRAGTV